MRHYYKTVHFLLLVTNGYLFYPPVVAGLFVNDSAYDFDPVCYYGPDGVAGTGDEYTCGGRLLMDFAPTCVPEVEAHTIVAEFVNLDDLGCESGGGDIAGGWDEIIVNGCADCD